LGGIPTLPHDTHSPLTRLLLRSPSSDFFTLPALAEFRYYWRVEPDVDFYCDLTYDPFVEMARRDKVYGWTMALWEIPETVPSLFRVSTEFMKQERIPETSFWRTMLQPEWMPWPLRAWRAMTDSRRDERGDRWSMCHFWSNFEIADLDWFRGERYQKYYRFLLDKGGFYQERVRTAIALNQILPS
jgi:mannosyltransferase